MRCPQDQSFSTHNADGSMRRLLAAVGACSAAWALAGSPEPPPTIEQLVARLGADSYADREAAMAALTEVGPAAIPALEAAAASGDPEVARRAAVLLVRIRRRADDALLTAKTVRLEYRNVPLGVAVADLAARTGLNVVLDPDRIADVLRPVTCVTGDLPVWEAVAAFCRAAGLREEFRPEVSLPVPEVPRDRTYAAPPPPAPTAETVPVVLIDGPVGDLPGNRSTAVRVLVLPPAFPGHRVILGTGETTLCFDVTPAPGLRWQDRPAVRVTRVIDDAGRTGGAALLRLDADPFVLPQEPGPVVRRLDATDVPPQPALYPNPRVVPVPLRLATPAARSLRVLEGAVVGAVIVPGQTLVTVELAAGRVVEGPNGLWLSVREVQTADGVTRVRVQLTGPSPGLAQRRRNPTGPLWPERPRLEGMTNQARAFDAVGRPVPYTTADVIDVRDDGTTLTTVQEFHYRRETGVPTKLAVVGPRTAVVEVPFTMANVPLP
jgi:hypothetical protein